MIRNQAAGIAVGVGLCLGVGPLDASASMADPPANTVGIADGPRTQEVDFDGGAPGVRLFGTLLLPPGAGLSKRCPAVVLVTGSGPQDRDESLAGKKPHKVLAEALAARGYAVLRYDDRGTKELGIGQSTGRFAGATLAEFSLDAQAAITFVAGRPEIDPARVAVCGHSTGGLESAMLLARGSSIRAAVLLAAPAVPGAVLLTHQTTAMLNATHRLGKSGLTDEQVARATASQTELVMAYVSGDADRLQRAAREAVAASVAIRSGDQAIPTAEQFERGAAQATAPFRETWMDHFLRYDPAPDLRASGVPVLAVFGGRDLQVASELNAGPATTALAAAGHPGSAVVILPVANHLFQSATTGLPAEYPALPGEMGPGVSILVADWLDRVMPGRDTDGASP